MNYLKILSLIIVIFVARTAIADVKSGQKLYSQRGCIACHGERGENKLGSYPGLNGRSASFIASELNKYRNGIRRDPTMSAMAAGLSDSEIESLAHFLAASKR
jgi:cytochrome c553